MPRGPRGEKRPADVIGAAVMAAKIATENSKNESATAELGRKGGKARSARDRPEGRTEPSDRASQGVANSSPAGRQALDYAAAECGCSLRHSSA